MFVMFFGIYSDLSELVLGWKGFRGTFDAWVIMVPAPREKLSQMLEGDIEPFDFEDLPAALQTSADEHPLIFMAGREYDVAPIFEQDADFEQFQYRTLFHETGTRNGAVEDELALYDLSIFPLDYLEVISSVPFCRFRDRAPLLCPTKLFLDELFPTLLGKFAAIPKTLTWDMQRHIHAFCSDNVLNRNVLDLYEAGRPGRPLQNWAHFELWQNIFRSPIMAPYPGRDSFSYIRSNWDLPVPSPVSLQCDVGSVFSEALNGRMGVGAISDASPYGAFKMTGCTWKLDMPDEISG